MKNLHKIAAVLAASASLYVVAAQAQTIVFAQGLPAIASYHARGMCLDVRLSDSAVLLWQCQGSGNQAFRFVSGNYGQISLGNQQCLTGGASGTGLTSRTCSSSNRSQKWAFAPDGSLRNETGLCADIEGGARYAGARIISYGCNSGATNQKFYPSVVTRSVLAGIRTLSSLNGGQVNGILTSTSFSGGNMVAAGGGNLVAAGGGNMVAAGGGNIVMGGAGTLIAAGGGNMVAAGGGNMVAAGGGNLVPNNWSFFSASTAGNLVGNDGASLRQ